MRDPDQLAERLPALPAVLQLVTTGVSPTAALRFPPELRGRRRKPEQLYDREHKEPPADADQPIAGLAEGEVAAYPDEEEHGRQEHRVANVLIRRCAGLGPFREQAVCFA